MDLKTGFVGVFVLLMAFLVFWSPILVSVLTTIFVLFFSLKSFYIKRKPIVNHLKPKPRPKSTQLMTIDDRFGVNPNVRHIKSARRQLPFKTRTVDNYVSNYLRNPLNSNYFLQSDTLLGSMSGQSLPSRPQSSNDMSYSTAIYRSIRESPTSQLGNLPFVKLSTSAEHTTHELKLKSQTVRPVTVRIAPMPQNLSKFSFNRSPNLSTNNSPTLVSSEQSMKPMMSSTQTQSIVEALKRKRGQRLEAETEDMTRVTANKKAKRDSNFSPKIANGMVSPNKLSFKRQANDGSTLSHKKFKNNEILSSYSSLQQFTPDLSQSLKNKRKLTPDSFDAIEVMNKKSLLPEEELTPIDSSNAYPITTTNTTPIGSNDDITDIREEPEESGLKRTYGLPIHLHSMEDHERDRNKYKHRVNRYLKAIKEVTSPKGPPNLIPTTAPDTTTVTTTSSEIGLPSVPAAVIFTNSRVDTVVTTSLLNSPISSVLTTTIECVSTSKPNVDNSDNPMTSAPNSPEVSAITTPFMSSTPLSAIGSTNDNIINENSFKFDSKSLDKSSAKPTNNIFNVPNSASTQPVLTISTNTSSTATNPQFSSSISIPNFSQMASNTALPFAGNPGSTVPTFPNVQQTLFTSEPPTQSLFSLGSNPTSGRRFAQNSRLRSRQKR